MTRMDSENTVPKQAMNGLERIILKLDPEDPGIYAFSEAYAQFWLMDLEDQERMASFEKSSRQAIQPIFGVLADRPISLDRGWSLAV
jgi:hypothetical protein